MKNNTERKRPARKTATSSSLALGTGSALRNLLDNSAVITPPDGDPCFVDIQCRAEDYEAAYKALESAEQKDRAEIERLNREIKRLRETVNAYEEQWVDEHV